MVYAYKISRVNSAGSVSNMIQSIVFRVPSLPLSAQLIVLLYNLLQDINDLLYSDPPVSIDIAAPVNVCSGW